jgi:hypothetical protein
MYLEIAFSQWSRFLGVSLEFPHGLTHDSRGEIGLAIWLGWFQLSEIHLWQRPYP